MCTIVVFHRIHADFPLVVAANRDEFYARGATPPEILATSPKVLGGRDLAKGGTWFGVSESAIFAGLTNQRTLGPPEPSKRSRGEIVSRALTSRSLDAIDDLLRSEDGRTYNPFNLIYGDGRSLRVAYARNEAAITIEEVPPGLFVLPNDILNSPAFPKVEHARRLAESLRERPWPELSVRLAALLGDHARPSLDEIPQTPASRFPPEILRELQAICVHTPVYGTRSAAILALRPGAVEHFLFADGSPCATSFVEYATKFSNESEVLPDRLA